MAKSDRKQHREGGVLGDFQGCDGIGHGGGPYALADF
jgi:hypothetical protein